MNQRIQNLVEAEAVYKNQLICKESEIQSLRKKFVESDERQEKLTAELPELEDIPSTATIRSYLNEQNRRIELLLLDLQEAQKTIEEYRQERDDLKSKVIKELQVAAETSKDAKDLLNTLFSSELAKRPI